MMDFNSKYPKNNDFLGYFWFESQKHCFLRSSVFSIVYSIFLIFLCFLYQGKFATAAKGTYLLLLLE